MKVLLSVAAKQKIANTHLTAIQTKRLKKAIVHIEDTPISQLCQSGVVHKLQVPGVEDLYSYRTGLSKRILFSSSKDGAMIHDIINYKSIK